MTTRFIQRPAMNAVRDVLVRDVEQELEETLDFSDPVYYMAEATEAEMVEQVDAFNQSADAVSVLTAEGSAMQQLLEPLGITVAETVTNAEGRALYLQAFQGLNRGEEEYLRNTIRRLRPDLTDVAVEINQVRDAMLAFATGDVGGTLANNLAMIPIPIWLDWVVLPVYTVPYTVNGAVRFDVETVDAVEARRLVETALVARMAALAVLGTEVNPYLLERATEGLQGIIEVTLAVDPTFGAHPTQWAPASGTLYPVGDQTIPASGSAGTTMPARKGVRYVGTLEASAGDPMVSALTYAEAN